MNCCNPFSLNRYTWKLEPNKFFCPLTTEYLSMLANGTNPMMDLEQAYKYSNQNKVYQILPTGLDLLMLDSQLIHWLLSVIHWFSPTPPTTSHLLQLLEKSALQFHEITTPMHKLLSSCHTHHFLMSWAVILNNVNYSIEAVQSKRNHICPFSENCASLLSEKPTFLFTDFSS